MENKNPPFYSQLVSHNFDYDTAFQIALTDSNADGDYFDIDCNSCDLISIKNNKYKQFSSNIFKPTTKINYLNDAFLFQIDTVTDSAFLIKQSIHFDNPDLYIFNEAPEINLFLLNDTSIAYNIREIVKRSATKYIFISFWAPFCVPCVEELEFYKDNIQEINNSNMSVVSISPNSLLTSSQDFYINRNYTISFYSCLDSDMKKLNCQGYPNGFLVDSHYNYIQHFSYSSISRIGKFIKNKELNLVN